MSDVLKDSLRKRATDYTPWGKVKRWSDEKKAYPDCSMGCKHFNSLHNKENPPSNMDYDYGVCTNPKSPRCGLLTFEHQAGVDCFENEETNSSKLME